MLRRALHLSLLLACRPDDGTSVSDTLTTATGQAETGGPDPTTGPASTSTSSTGSATTLPRLDLGVRLDIELGDCGGSFLCPGTMDFGPSECDTWAQDCPPGMKCVAYGANGGAVWDATKCIPVMDDPKQPGEPCTVEGNVFSGIDDCDIGAVCWDVDEANIGTCVALCIGTPEAPDCTAPSTSCALGYDGFVAICLDNCDPLVQDCPAGLACVANPDDVGFLCAFDVSGDSGQQHDPCESVVECDPGLHCGPKSAAAECVSDGPGCCEPFCDLGDPEAAMKCGGAGQVCVSYYGMNPAPPGQENVGVCTVPPP